jgi:hypothetical protein
LGETGVGVSKPDHSGEAVVQTIREMQRAEHLNMADLEGWEVRVVDAGGTVVMELSV